MVKNWQVAAGLFSVPGNWSPSQSPVAGDNLSIQSGNPSLTNQTFGSAAVGSTIGLANASPANAPTFSLTNATLENVEVNDAPPAFSGSAPSGYYGVQYGNVSVTGTVVNAGGIIEGGRDSRLPGNLHVLLQPGAILINKGILLADPMSQLTIVGSSGSTLQNDDSIVAAGGKVTVAAHLTGTGQVDVQPPGAGTASTVELTAAVDAGQTFQIARGVLQVDHPSSFLGKVDIAGTQGPGEVKLQGLNAASWATQGSLLEVFNAAGAQIDTLRFTAPQDPIKLAVYSVPDPTYGHAVAIMPTLGTAPPTGAILLPQHLA